MTAKKPVDKYTIQLVNEDTWEILQEKENIRKGKDKRNYK